MQPDYIAIQVHHSERDAVELTIRSIVQWLSPTSELDFDCRQPTNEWVAVYPKMLMNFKYGKNLAGMSMRISCELSKDLKVPVLFFTSCTTKHLHGAFIWSDKVFGVPNGRFEVPRTNHGPVTSIIPKFQQALLDGLNADIGAQLFTHFMSPLEAPLTSFQHLCQLSDLLGCEFENPELVWKKQSEHEAGMPPSFRIVTGNWGEEKYIGDPVRPSITGENVGQASSGILVSVSGSILDSELVAEATGILQCIEQSGKVKDFEVKFQRADDGFWRAIAPQVPYNTGCNIEARLLTKAIRRGSGTMTLSIAPLKNESGSCSINFSMKIRAKKPTPPEKEYEKTSRLIEFQQTLEKLASLTGSNAQECKARPGVFEFTVLEDRLPDCQQLQAGITSNFIVVKKSILPYERTIRLYATKDKYSVVQVEGTNGGNYDMDNKKLISWLKKLERTNPFVLIACNNASMAGKFLAPVPDASSLAKQFEKICPDIGDVQAYAAELQTSQTFILWWD